MSTVTMPSLLTGETLITVELDWGLSGDGSGGGEGDGIDSFGGEGISSVHVGDSVSTACWLVSKAACINLGCIAIKAKGSLFLLVTRCAERVYICISLKYMTRSFSIHTTISKHTLFGSIFSLNSISTSFVNIACGGMKASDGETPLTLLSSTCTDKPISSAARAYHHTTQRVQP